MAEIDAVILAAGLSQRMGSDKLLLPFAGTTVFHYFLSRFPLPLFSKTVVVVANPAVARLCDKFPVCLCHNDSPELGQSHSIRLGLEATAEQNATLFCVADQPLLKAKTVFQLVALSNQNPDHIIRPRIGARSANPVIFPADLRGELTCLTGDSGGREVIHRHTERIKWLEMDSADQFFDIDTPEQYQELLEQC